MLALMLALAFQQSPPPLLQRAHQPRLMDPGLDGNMAGGFIANGDLTPDGRLLIAYRDTIATANLRVGLIAAAVRPDRLRVNAHGFLDGFFVPPTPPALFGSAFVFRRIVEQKTIHHGFVPVPGVPPSPPTPLTDCDQDPFFPVPGQYGNAHITVALRPLAQGNPYRSALAGVPQEDGQYLCYKLWVVRTHTYGYEDGTAVAYDHLACKSGPNEPMMVEPGTSRTSSCASSARTSRC